MKIDIKPMKCPKCGQTDREFEFSTVAWFVQEQEDAIDGKRHVWLNEDAIDDPDVGTSSACCGKCGYHDAYYLFVGEDE